MAVSAALIPVQEYLETTYRPDCDYIQGELRKRNVGERPHSRLQAILGAIFEANLSDWRALAMTEQRVQILADRYRVADVCVVRDTDPDDLITVVPPLLCIEILSRGDSLAELEEAVDDYAHMGVQTIWVINPWKRIGYNATVRGLQQPSDGVLRVPTRRSRLRCLTCSGRSNLEPSS